MTSAPPVASLSTSTPTFRSASVYVVRQKERHIRALEQETFEQGARIAELEAWKRDASRVLRAWHAVGDAIIERFGVDPPLGESVAAWCLRIVKGAPSL